MEFLSLPERTQGERLYGITSVTDFGVPTGELQHILADYHSLIDVAKIGVGSACVTPNLKEKINLYKEYGVKTYCGGTLFEKCYLQGKVKEYVEFLKEMEIDWVEVSNGTLDIPLVERLDLVDKLKDHFQVIGEVGSKDSTKDMDVKEWNQEIAAFLDAGCEYVITEGRDSGTSGIYHSNGEVKSDLILDVVENIDEKKIIFEATNPKHQMYFINQFGANVNLGNVRIRDVILLESQRLGLRSETFYTHEGKSSKLKV